MANITTVTLDNNFEFLMDRVNELISRANALGEQTNVAITGGTVSGVDVNSATIESSPIGATSPSTGRFTSLTLINPLSISQGGTGSTTAEDARDNLGFANASNLTEGVLDDNRIPELSATKITSGVLSIGDFSVDIEVEKSGAAKIAAKGSGSAEVYSYLSLESDESEDKGWQIYHRKDSANRLAFYYNLTQMAAYFDPTTRGLVVGSTTSGGSPAVGSINAKSYYVDGVKISDYATADLPGIVELATTAEVITGSDTTRAVTSAGVTAALADRIATSGEAIALVNATEFLTPSSIAAIFGNTTARVSLNIADPSFETISGNDTLVLGDKASNKRITATCTIGFSAASTLGDGWYVDIMVDGDPDDLIVVTLDPNSSEEIDLQTTVKAYAGEQFRVYCNGTSFRTTRQTEVFLGTLNFTSGANSFDFFVNGAFLDDPEIFFSRALIENLSRVGTTGSTDMYMRMLNGSGVAYSSSGDYNQASLTQFSTANYQGAESNTITEIDLTPDGSIASQSSAPPMVLEMKKYSTIMHIRLYIMKADNYPNIYEFHVDGEVGGIRLYTSGGANFDGGTVHLWGTRRRLA